jgi:hypothetical protein
MKRLGKKIFIVLVIFVAVYGLVKYTNVKEKAADGLKEYYKSSREVVNEDGLVKNIVESNGIDVNGFIDTAEEMTNKALENVTPETMESVFSEFWRLTKNVFTFLFNSAESLAKNTMGQDA